MQNNFAATVAAISTPPGKGGVALIRVSGSDAVGICDKVFRPRSGKALSSYPSRVQVRGDIMEGEELIDDGMATVFRAPGSYTGEDTVEFTCHGGVLVTRTVLETVFAAGAKPAGPGEFTKRAFLNGKLSLTDAEGIGILLDAQGREGLRLGAMEARDRLSDAIGDVKASLVSVMSSLYARIDYPDEDLGEYGDKEVSEALEAAEKKIKTLLDTYKTGRAVTEGISTVFVGKPNVGKSSVYNLLLGEDAAIVTDIAGTTRDVLEKTVPLGRVLLRLFDTAGLRETSDPIEKIGVERTRAALAKAELILAVFDASAPLDEEDFELMETLKVSGAPAVALLNKSDLPENPATAEAIKAAFPTVISLSGKTGDGLGMLRATVEGLFTDEKIVIGRDPVLSSARQFAALTRASGAVSEALRAFRAGVFADAASSDIEHAVSDLGEIDGREVSEDVVNGIFSKFCVGK